jgi:hypothetical protein
MIACGLIRDLPVVVLFPQKFPTTIVCDDEQLAHHLLVCVWYPYDYVTTKHHYAGTTSTPKSAPVQFVHHSRRSNGSQLRREA